MVSMLGIVVMMLGIYSVFWYLDRYGNPASPMVGNRLKVLLIVIGLCSVLCLYIP